MKKGTNAIVRDPSENSFLMRLGNLKETKKTSDNAPVPKTPAITASLINPKIRLRRVIPDIRVAALIKLFLFTSVIKMHNTTFRIIFNWFEYYLNLTQK